MFKETKKMNARTIDVFTLLLYKYYVKENKINWRTIMKNNNLVKALSVLVVASLVSASAWAASASGSPATHSLTVGVASLFKLSLSNSTVSLGSNLDPDNSPIESAGALTVTMKNNNNSRNLYLQTYIDGDLTSAADHAVTISKSQVYFKGGDVGSYTPFTTTAQTVKTLSAGSSRGTNTVAMDYKLVLNWTDQSASDYSAVVTYTLTDTI